MKTRDLILGMGAGAAALGAVGMAASYPLTIRHDRIASPKIRRPVTLAVVSDLHGIVYGSGQAQLLEKIHSLSPHGILLPGDIVDERLPWEGSWALLRALGRAYPCWYTAGNHEFRIPAVAQVKDIIRSYGVHVLEGTVETVTLNGQDLAIGGYDWGQGEPYASDWETQRDNCFLRKPEGTYSILLCHRPDCIDDFCRSGFELAVSGHAHGGQWRLPGLINGLYAPHQGLFPQYAGGLYSLGKTHLVVSRGLRRDWLPRVFNPPEVVAIHLEPGKTKTG